MSQNENADVFENPDAYALTLPRDKAWDNWMKWETVGQEVKGYIRDVFYRPAEGEFPEQRGLTLEKPDGELVNVGIKRLPFILNKTDHLRLNDALVMRFEEEKPPAQKGYSPTKIFGFYGQNLEANAEEKTVLELEKEDMAKGGTATQATGEDSEMKEAAQNF